MNRFTTAICPEHYLRFRQPLQQVLHRSQGGQHTYASVVCASHVHRWSAQAQPHLMNASRSSSTAPNSGTSTSPDQAACVLAHQVWAVASLPCHSLSILVSGCLCVHQDGSLADRIDDVLLLLV